MHYARLITTLGLLTVVALIAATTAQARDGWAYHPRDPSYAHMTNDHWITACDRQVDGHRVRGWYDVQGNIGFYHLTGWAPSRGCHKEGSTWALNIMHFRICVEGEGCGPWWHR